MSKSSKSTRITSKDLALLMVMDGLSAIASKHENTDGGLAPATVDGAIELLAKQPSVAAELQAFRDETFVASNGQRGRPAVAVGDSRDYKAQQINDGSVFIRLPVDLLGVAKEGAVTVSFEAGRLVVTAKGYRAPETETATTSRKPRKGEG